MTRRLSQASLDLGRQCPTVHGRPSPRYYIDSPGACELAGVNPSTLSLAAQRGELTLYHHQGKAYWSKTELVEWSTPEAKRGRMGRPKKVIP